MKLFKPANPNSRIPAVLQKNTKENLVFQLTLVGVLLVVTFAKEAYDSHQFKKQLEEDYPNLNV